MKTVQIQRAILVEVDGITDSLAGTAKRVGITFYRLRSWMKRGFSPQLICDRWRELRGRPRQRLFPPFTDTSGRRHSRRNHRGVFSIGG